MNKIRLVSEKQVKKAYNKSKVLNKTPLKEEILKEELCIDSVDRLPDEVFSILGETLLFIEKVNKIEGDKK